VNLALPALHRFPLVKPAASLEPRADPDAHPSDWSLHRLRHVQDYLYDKTELMVSVHDLVLSVRDLGLVWTAEGTAVPPYPRSTTPSVLPDVEFSLIQADGDDEKDSSISADDSGFFDGDDILKKVSAEDVTSIKEDSQGQGLVNDFARALSLRDTTPPPSSPASASATTVTSPSMSRRRLASHLPALSIHVELPPPPTSEELMGLKGPLKNLRRSPGLTINPPAPLVNVDSPILFSDRVLNNSELSNDQATGFTRQAKQDSMLDFQQAPLSMSPCLIRHSSGTLSVPLATLFEAPPRTPVDQVMPAPSQPPALPRRTAKNDHSSIIRDVSSDDEFATTEPMRTPRQALATRRWSSKSITALMSPREEELNPFLTVSGDVEATPRPQLLSIRKSRIMSLKPRDSPIFALRKPLQDVSTRSRLLPSSSSPDALRCDLNKLALDSPLLLDDSSPLVRNPLGQPSTPLAYQEVHDKQHTGTPNYFSARTYFAEN
jgi:hypothetical protein